MNSSRFERVAVSKRTWGFHEKVGKCGSFSAFFFLLLTGIHTYHDFKFNVNTPFIFLVTFT